MGDLSLNDLRTRVFGATLARIAGNAAFLSILMSCILLPAHLCAGEHDRQEAEIQYSRGLFALNQQEYQEAWQRFEAAHSYAPNEARHLLYMGIADNRLGRFDRASGELNLAERLDASLPQLPYERGVTAMGLGNWDVALAHLEEARSRQPRRGEVYLRLGVVHDQLKNPSEAMSFFEKAEALDPSLADQAAFYKGRTYLQTGMIDKARDQFQVASGSSNSQLNDLSGDYLGRIDVAEDGPPERWEFTGWVAAAYDDNVVLNPNDPSALGISNQEDSRAILYADVMFHPWVGRRGTFGVGIGAYQSVHQDLDEYDLFGIIPEVEYTYVDGDFFLQARASYSDFELDNTGYMEALEIEVRPGFRQASIGRTEFIVAYTDEDFAVNQRSGSEWGAGVQQFLYPWDNKKRYTMVEAVYKEHDAENNFERSELAVSGGFYTPFGNAWDFFAGIKYTDFDYENVHSFFGETRGDEEWRALLRASWGINDWLALVIDYRYTDHSSNITFFDYDRQVITVGILATP